ncbi:MAG: phage tail protein [Sarcina sp.]
MFDIREKSSGKSIECISKSVQFSKNQASILTFELIPTSKYFNQLKRFVDQVNVVDLRNNDVIFTGRVIVSSRAMSDSGEFTNLIQCEGILNYLNDVHVDKWEFYPLEIPTKAAKNAVGNFTTKMFITKVLEKYNSEIEASKRIFCGNIEVEESVYIKTNYETCLNSIQTNICDKYQGYLVIRESDGNYYLDFLKNSPVIDVVDINVSENMKTISIGDTVKNVFSRIIPMGKNGLTIDTVNNGCNYIEDVNLVKKYGVIETVMQWNEVTIPAELIQNAKGILNKINFDKQQIQLTALDLSYINNNIDALKLYRPIKVKNNNLNYYDTHEIVSINMDLYHPYLSTFDLSEQSSDINNDITSMSEQLTVSNMEIVALGDELITKVSNSGFESYKIQTSKEIEDKISSSGAESIFKEKVSSFDFTIGKDTPLTITKDGLIMKFGNNTKCELNAQGLFWDRDGKDYEYNCLCSNGSFAKVQSGESVKLQLPSQFIGKKYYISWWAGNLFMESAQDLLYTNNVYKVDENIDEGWVVLKADLMVRNPETENSPNKRGCMNIMWVAIA